MTQAVQLLMKSRKEKIGLLRKQAYGLEVFTLYFLFIISCLSVACSGPPKDTMQRIIETGKVVVITDNNANTYYNYRGEPMGFEYDLATAFADYLGVKLEVITPGWDRMFKALNDGNGDFIAAGLTVTEPRKNIVDFSDDYFIVQQQVVVHKDNRSMNKIQDLGGATIHIRSGTSYQERLQELKIDGIEINIASHPNVPTEELIRQVALKEIDITIADSNIAHLNRRYYPDIRIAFPLEEQQSLAWAVRKGDKNLVKRINEFFNKMRQNGTFGKIYQRYYSNVEIFDYVDLKKLHKRLKTRLPKYKRIIKKEAEKHNFDWRMIAAVVYQESHFNPRAISYTGVKGLMQVTQRTAEEMGITNRLDPAQSIEAGVKYLANMYGRFEIIDDQRERFLFALASYNIGYGHIQDAQSIASGKGLNPKKWASMKICLPLLRSRKYYQDTKYGYARGTEPVRYVRRVMTYYDVLKREAHT